MSHQAVSEKRIGLEVSLAVAEAVKLADVDAIAAYPITPQTHIVETLSEIVANGELNAAYIPVESEHSALSACLGTIAAGARTFTATSSQGLALMHEMLFIASGLRMPVIMAVANRSLSAPLSIWGDHSDVMANRDVGWVQLFVENGQEALDITLSAFRIGEDKRVLLPVMVNLDGFTLSHVVESLIIPDESKVRRFLPPFEPLFRLDPLNPIMIGAIGIPEIYTEARKALDETLTASRIVVDETFAAFKNIFGREYHCIETYRSNDAETILITMGALSGTARLAIDELRSQGESVGLVRIRLWRPFPFDDIRAALGKAKVVVVFDRAISPGGPGGPVASEIRNALYSLEPRPKIVNFVGGLGGRDVRAKEFIEMIRTAKSKADAIDPLLYTMVGVRE